MLRRLAKLRARLRAFGADARGVSAVEFALISPLLVGMVGGAVELGGALTAANRATYVADSIGELVSQVNARITEPEMNGFIRSAALINPDVVRYAAQTGKELDQAVNVTVSGIQFVQQNLLCTADCAYHALVVFSAALSGPARACGTLASGLVASPTTLPADVYSSGSLVVVDVEVFYKPMMNMILGDTLSFKRSTYFRPRYVSRVNYEHNCPLFKIL